MKRLSLIIPFHNSHGKCDRLLERLKAMDDPRVEIVLVDDGSVDDTPEVLEAFAAIAATNVCVIRQDNRGPGGARNTGLDTAKGDYVWFVDSDDDVHLPAIDFIIENVVEGYDFIDFNCESAGRVSSSMGLDCGVYEVTADIRLELLKNFGRICTKAFRRDFLIGNGIRYPEYCIYEDNPMSFVLPFMLKRFLKTDLLGYVHHEDFKSVTRSKVDDRYLDRLLTSSLGLSKWMAFEVSDKEKDVVAYKFLRLYLLNTTRKLTRRGSGRWLLCLRIMRQYRHIAEMHDLLRNPLSFYRASLRRKLLFRCLWRISFLMVDQTDYFHRLRQQVWGSRPTGWESMSS